MHQPQRAPEHQEEDRKAVHCVQHRGHGVRTHHPAATGVRDAAAPSLGRAFTPHH